MEASCNFELAVRYLYADLTALPATVNLGDPSRAKAGEKSRGTCVLAISRRPFRTRVPCPSRALALAGCAYDPRPIWETRVATASGLGS